MAGGEEVLWTLVACGHGSYQAYEMAHSCNLQKENKAAAERFNNVTEAGDFEPADKLPKYHWFICHLPYVQADLHYDYGADYYFIARNA